ncbi:hypothetical protein GGI35DRAFT_492474 [Trichoderma velutinum]
MASQADQQYQLERRYQQEILRGITDYLLAMCGQGGPIQIIPVTKPSIDTGSWVYERSGFGAKVIQKPDPVGYVSWREYKPDGRDRASIVVYYSALMNDGSRNWDFQLAIHDPDQFWRHLGKNGDIKTDMDEYYKFLATLWSETNKIPFKPNKLQISLRIDKFETVNFPKAQK